MPSPTLELPVELLEAITDGVLLVREDGSIALANEAICRILDRSREELGRTHLWEIDTSLTISTWADRWVGSAAAGSEPGPTLAETAYRTKSGSLVPVEVSLGLFESDGEALRTLVVRDITERRNAAAELWHDELRSALVDPLTGLSNRHYFADRLQRCLRCLDSDSKTRVAVLALDVDRFKVINDTRGHAFGDRLLERLARRLQENVDEKTPVARLSGGLFAILLEEVRDLSDARRIADQIQRSIALPFEIDGHELYMTVSVGIALSDAETSKDTLIRDAEAAMYHAKAEGRSRQIVFDHAAHATVRARTDLEADLYHAVSDREILVHYQPIINLVSGRIAGFEALARWQHPRRGLIPPMQFIPLAEETELVVPIDRLVLEEATRQCAAWRRELPTVEPVSISVNFSGRQFTDPKLVEEVQRILETTGAPHEQVKIEITESAIMRNQDAATKLLEGLRQLGLSVCIDDFGTGYSSLGYLHVLPVDVLKVDRSFVGGMDGENRNLAIVCTIVSLAEHLGLSVIAEGVETDEQRDTLRDLGCEFAQGFLFSRPVDAAAATDLLRAECRE